jgi:tRNA threonylcarbamoyladenosine biosynthesis protein TsaB
MALILNIDTATENAIISIAENGITIDFTVHSDQKDHASFLQPAIKELLQKADLPINKLNAVAVTAGPGSYTGLRVGMASAKGLCYALSIPLLAVNTLEVMAQSGINQLKDRSALYCPMIDARRMEVFTAVYDYDLKEVMKPCPVIVDEGSFKELLQNKKMYFFGNGSLKLKKMQENANATFINSKLIPDAMSKLSFEKYQNKSFEDLFYSAPIYLKEFYTVGIRG